MIRLSLRTIRTPICFYKGKMPLSILGPQVVTGSGVSVPGPQGAQGVKGDTGPPGTSFTGPQGTSSTGMHGPIGSQGVAGTSYTGATGAAAPTTNPTFSGTLTCPTIHAQTTLEYAGSDINTLYQPKIWVCAYITYGSSSATVSSNNSKAASVTASWTSTGTYSITYSTTPGSVTPTAVFLCLHNAVGMCNYSGLGTTSVAVQTFSTGGSAANYSFTLMVIL
jgi:hypothetical protein